MTTSSERLDLFELLPAIYRSLDLAAGSPLQALMGVMQAQYDALDADIAQLYDNWFIETCQEWAAPYLGQLVGTDWLLGPNAVLEPTRRALVAEAIAASRRKGTVPLLQALSWAATGWPARAIEARPHLVATQTLTALRPGQAGYVSIADANRLASLGTPFDHLYHRADMADAGIDGVHNLGSIAVYLWRLIAFPMQAVVAAADSAVPNAYRCDPLGRDLPLFAPPSEPVPRDTTADPRALPVAITRQALAEDLTAYRRQWSTAATPPPDSLYYGPHRGLVITVGTTVLSPLDIVAADLTTWPNALPSGTVALLDPELGRFMVAASGAVTIDFGYGFSAAMGGGPYGRVARMADPASAVWSITVGPGGTVTGLDLALAQWQQAKPPAAVITILDSATYANLPPSLVLPGDSRLCIQSADQQRPAVTLPASWDISGSAMLELSGLLLQGGVSLSNDTRLTIRDCTLLPPSDSASTAPITAAAGMNVAIVIENSIVPAFTLPASAKLSISDSIVDPFGLPAAIASPDGAPDGPVLSILRSTILGPITATRLVLAEDSLFMAPVVLAEPDLGVFRYSYAAEGSILPPAYRAQPMLALAEAAAELGLPGPDALPPDIRAAVIAAVTPRFTSIVLPQAGFAQLTLDTAAQIAGGASDGGAMGAFNRLHETQMRRVLLRLLVRFVPLGSKVNPVFVT